MLDFFKDPGLILTIACFFELLAAIILGVLSFIGIITPSMSNVAELTSVTGGAIAYLVHRSSQQSALTISNGATVNAITQALKSKEEPSA